VLRRLALVLLPLLLLAAACGGDGDAGADADGGSDAGADAAEADDPAADEAAAAGVFPGAEWEVADPADEGLAAEPLVALAGVMDGADSNCMTVVHDGRIVADEYWNGTDATTEQEVFSATKSMTSTLVGIAQEEGLLDIDEPASTYIDEWVGTDSEDVTIRNLLSNDSGRFYTFANDYGEMAGRAHDKSAFAIGLTQQHPIGEHWEYNNSAIQVLEEVLQRATGEDMAEYARTRLFEPIGMSTEINHDGAGNTLAFMGAQASCHDLARFGHLFLNEGAWDGEQVVPQDWVAEATQPSQELNPGYGFLWWLFAEGTTPVEPGQPEPPGAYAALGLGGQVVLVIPEDDLVVVRMGPAAQIGVEAARARDLLIYAHEAVAEGA
jgi:CubicO group peptidase (beta-lactamase class C family)